MTVGLPSAHSKQTDCRKSIQNIEANKGRGKVIYSYIKQVKK